MILALDRAVGTILQSLEKNNLSDNTIVIFTSDNGGTSIVNQRHINFPFRGWKATFYEGGLRVPLLMKWPKYLPKYSMNSEDIVSHVDIFPTLLHAAAATTRNAVTTPPATDAAAVVGEENDSSAGSETLSTSATATPHDGSSQKNDFDGVSWLPHILSSPLFSQHHQGKFQEKSQICQSNSRTHDTLFWRSGHYSSLRYCQWKYQISSNPSKVWLYDLVNDPQEKQNLATVVSESSDETKSTTKKTIANPDPYIQEVLRELSKRLRDEDRKQVKPLWNSLSETPVLVDKIFKESYVEGDEYIYWPN